MADRSPVDGAREGAGTRDAQSSSPASPAASPTVSGALPRATAGVPILCSWCDQPATTEVEVKPARFRPGRSFKPDPKTGRRVREQILVERELKAPACGEHALIPRTPPCPARRKSAPGAEQTTIFDVPGV